MIKRIFVTILVIGLTACHVGQLTTLYTDKTSYEQDGIRYDAQNLPITGVYHKYSKTMRLQEESHYVDGKLDTKKENYTAKQFHTTIPVTKKKYLIINLIN